MTSLQILPFYQPEIVPSYYATIQNLDSKGNLGNLSKTLLVNILVKIGIVESIQI